VNTILTVQVVSAGIDPHSSYAYCLFVAVCISQNKDQALVQIPEE